MANQIAIRLHSRPGDELIGEENGHVFISELGGPAVHSGVVTRGRRRAWPAASAPSKLAPRPRPARPLAADARALVENTHNARGGRIWPLDEIGELSRAGARARPRASTSTARGS